MNPPRKGYKIVWNEFNGRYEEKPIGTFCERLGEFLITWFFRSIVILFWIIVIAAIVAYFAFCIPAWFQTLLNAPVICIPRGS